MILWRVLCKVKDFMLNDKVTLNVKEKTVLPKLKPEKKLPPPRTIRIDSCNLPKVWMSKEQGLLIDKKGSAVSGLIELSSREIDDTELIKRVADKKEKELVDER